MTLITVAITGTALPVTVVVDPNSNCVFVFWINHERAGIDWDFKINQRVLRYTTVKLVLVSARPK